MHSATAGVVVAPVVGAPVVSAPHMHVTERADVLHASGAVYLQPVAVACCIYTTCVPIAALRMAVRQVNPPVAIRVIPVCRDAIR